MRMDVRPTRAVRAALSMAAVSILITPAQAQQQSSSTQAAPEEIVVTGSRIRRLDRETASPVQMVAREVDLFASYAGLENTVLRASITNVLDKTAPFDPYTYGGLNYNPTFHQAGALGRVFNVGMTYKF